MKILLATPTHDHMVHAAFYRSVVDLVAHFVRERPDVEFVIDTHAGTLIDRARNILATRVLNDPSFTHLLFVDSDMGFRPSLIERMLAFDKPILGALTPQRRLDHEALHRWSQRLPDGRSARAAALGYVAEGEIVAEPKENGEVRIDVVDGFVRVRQIGAGVLLVQRSALERFKDRFPELWVRDAGADYAAYPWCAQGLLQCFAPLKRASGLFISEDLAFSTRWVAGCKGELWACVAEPIAHVGREAFAGAFVEKMELAASASPAVRREPVSDPL
jgi:hypothetical protein